MNSTDVVAAYEAALPDDPRIARKRMFGSPAAFVNRQMFFGTFEASLVARVGERRAKALAGEPGHRVFAPSVEKSWPDYVAIDLPADPEHVAALAREALAWSAALPQNAKAPKEVRRARRKG